MVDEKTLSANSRFSTYMELLFLFDKSMGVKKTIIQNLTCKLLSTLMQLLFSFD